MTTLTETTAAALVLTTITARLHTERETWTAAIADRAETAKYGTACVGQPFVVYCGGLVLRIVGTTATPVAARPSVTGCLGASHMTREDAARIASIFGAGYRVVDTRDVPAIRIAEIDALLVDLAA
jgi:hypothetical protein